MQTIRIAIATDDGNTCIERHFGDAQYYYLYDIDDHGVHFIDTLKNTVDIEEQESTHGDPRKASGIGGLLKKFQVNTAVSKVFGPNIKRLQKQYACILVAADDIPVVLEILVQEKERIITELEKGENRSPVDLRKIDR
jgi:predicted Fe-Mo cluster-binding NifX family protein